MSDKIVIHRRGPGAAFLLGILFVGLKLTGYISWPWLWVLAPFWIGLAVTLGLVAFSAIVVGLGAIAVAWIESSTSKKKSR